MSNHHLLAYHAQQTAVPPIPQIPLTHLPVTDSPGLRLGILGYGAIGRQCARLAQALGMSVYAYTRSARPTASSRRDDSYCVPGIGDPDGLIPARWFSGTSQDRLDHFLAQDLDVLVICAPLTASTAGVISRRQFDILARRKTFVSNVGRGAIVDTEALADALEAGKIRGAALDVTDPEPLPVGHRLLRAPNCFVTPHVSWQTPHFWERVYAVLERNLEGLAAGDKGRLINVVDRERGY